MMIPEKPLADVLSYIRGITFKPVDLVDLEGEDAVVCMRTKNIQSKLDESSLIAVPDAFVKRDEQYLQKNDILISSANSWNLVGKCVQVPRLEYTATAGGFISILRPNVDVIDANYLYRWLMSKAVQHNIRNLGRQTTNISNLDRVRFLQLNIPVPPLPTQKRIAAILDKADQLRRQAVQMETELNLLAQSVFLDMFGDPVTNPKGWLKLPISALGVIQGGLQVSHKRETLPEEVPYLRVANVYRDRLVLDEVKTMRVTSAEKVRVLLQTGDVLIVEGHGNKQEIGRCAVWDGSIGECIHQNHLIRVRFDQTKIRADYASAYLNSEGGRRQLFRSSKTTSGLNTISASNVKSTEILVPSLELQNKYLHILSLVNEQVTYTQKVKEEQLSLFQSLIQKAFKDELNLDKTEQELTQQQEATDNVQLRISAGLA